METGKSTSGTVPGTSEMLVTGAMTGKARKEVLEPDGLPVLPVFGLPGPDFYVIHVSAVVSLSVSVLASLATIGNMLKDGKSPWKRPIGERLVFYLAISDLGYSLSHDLEHSYFLVTRDHPVQWSCVTMAFFMLTFYAASGFVVLFTAINAVVMVVLDHKIALGAYDWRLLVVTFGGSAVLMVISAGLGYLGPTGAWCEFDVRTTGGQVGGQLISACTLIIFAIDLVCYACVFIKLRRATLSAHGGSSKYHRSARVMAIFVVTNFVQNWPAMIFYIWAYFQAPPAILAVFLVVFVNMGGVFNGFAYTFVRKRYQNVVAAKDVGCQSRERHTASLTERPDVTSA